MPNHRPHSGNVGGDFYVVDGCCTACGVPDLFAPELFGRDSNQHCFVKRQPAAPTELSAMLRVVVNQDVGCIRYAGSDASVLRRLVESGVGGQCDAEPPSGLTAVRRDHVTFVVEAPGEPPTARSILERLLQYLEAQPKSFSTTSISRDDSGALACVSVSWFEDRFHRIEARVLPGSNQVQICHFAPIRFSDTLHDWLSAEPNHVDICWQTFDEWQTNGAKHPTPW